MDIAMAYLYDGHEKKISISKQLGVHHAVINVCKQNTALVDNEPFDFTPFIKKVENFNEQEIKVSVVEGPTPLERTKLGLAGRDREIEVFCELIKLMGKLDIKTLCYNWMPVVGWYRSLSDVPARGGATVTGYKHEMMKDAPLTKYGVVTKEQLWNNLEYFLKAVVPVAEENGIQLAIHPDDPPVDSIMGISRILTNFDAFQRAISLVPSNCNGITLCQGSFATMGENVQDMIHYFSKEKKLFFAHFRDIKGSAEDFVETFHDAGQTNMYECMKLYEQLNFSGCIRPDHVPTMLGEENATPGYSIMGNLFAIGYMRGLIQAAQNELKYQI